MRFPRWILFLWMLTATLCSACNGNSQAQPASPAPTATPYTRVPLKDALITEVVPTADGGAYILADVNNIWYVRGETAVRVREVDKLELSQQSASAGNDKTVALWLSELKLRKELEAKIAELESEASDDK